MKAIWMNTQRLALATGLVCSMFLSGCAGDKDDRGNELASEVDCRDANPSGESSPKTDISLTIDSGDGNQPNVRVKLIGE